MVAPKFPYHLGQTAAVVASMADLFARARNSGRTAELATALADIARSLQSDPLAFGDPWYSTIHDGGQVLHRVTAHLAIRYVVFKKEKKVAWLNLRSHDHHWDTPPQ